MAALEMGMSKLVSFARRRRRWLIGIASAIVVYALLGFLLVPWLGKKLAIEGVSENLNAELAIERVAFNPFLLRLEVNGLALDDLDGEPLAGFDTFVIDFQSSSLFRWALTFKEIRLDGPEVYLSRDSDGAINFASIVRDTGDDTAVEAPPESAEADSGPLRLLVRSLAINDSRVYWLDEVPPEPVDTVVGPISVGVNELSTLPAREGQQEVVIATESDGTLRWSGSLSLNPFASAGTASIEGSHFPLLSAYIRHETGLDILDGIADIRFTYDVRVRDDGEFAVAVDDLALGFRDILVRTFSRDSSAVSRDLLRVPAIDLAGGSLRYPEQELSLGDFEISDAVLDIVRLASGELDIAQAREEAPADPPPETTPPADDESSWSVSLDRFAISNLAVNSTDYALTPPAESGIRSLDLEILEIDNQPGSAFPTTLSLAAWRGGTIRVAGPVVVLPEPVLDLDIVFDGVVLAGFDPYLEAQADISLNSGALNLDGKLRHDPSNPLLFDADIEIVDFLLTETDEGSRLGSWAALVLDGVALDVGNSSFEISEVRLDQPYADVLIAEDGSVNLGRVRKADAAPATESAETAADESAAPFDVTVGRIVIENAAADFADESLPLPFAARIEALNGDISTIATSSREPSAVELEGKVDEFGFVRISGSLTPLDVTRDTDLAVRFENVEIPKFSAYTVPFAGREIATGRLDLDLGYVVTDSQLLGENRIVLRDFELGAEVDHPDAMNLPLGLAVALLKDPSGKIDIDLPVRGDLDDPEFGYGKVIASAIANLIVKVVASPFTLLGNLVGVEPDELEFINFPPGRADLAPPEVERTIKLAEALSLRPELVLEVHGVVDRAADTLALKTMRVDETIEGRIEATSEDDDTDYTAARFEAIEILYRETVGDDPATLDALRASHMTIEVDEESGKEREQFDSLAFAEALRDRLIEAEPIEEAALVELGAARRENTRVAVIAAADDLQTRVVARDLREEEGGGPDDVVRMKVVLGAGQ